MPLSLPSCCANLAALRDRLFAWGDKQAIGTLHDVYERRGLGYSVEYAEDRKGHITDTACAALHNWNCERLMDGMEYINPLDIMGKVYSESGARAILLGMFVEEGIARGYSDGYIQRILDGNREVISQII